MRIRHLENAYAIRVEPGEEVVAALKSLAKQEGFGFAYFWAIGGMSSAKFIYVDLKKDIRNLFELSEQCEVLSLIGNISWDENNEPFIHTHVVLGKEDGTTLGGHLIEGVVYPMLEVFVQVFADQRMNRKLNLETKAMFWAI